MVEIRQPEVKTRNAPSTKSLLRQRVTDQGLNG